MASSSSSSTTTTIPLPSLSASASSSNAHRRPRGLFIVVEGLDRAGKSTQVDLLAARLRRERHNGREDGVRVMKFPDRTTGIGKMLNSYLTDTSLSMNPRAVELLFSANRWELSRHIVDLLHQGVDIVADRYAASGVAYTRANRPASLADDSSSEGAFSDGLIPLLAPDTGLPCPDLTLFLSVSPAVAAQRGGYGEERYEKVELQARVRRAFEAIGRRVDAGLAEGERKRWINLSADSTPEDVAGEIQKQLDSLLTWHAQGGEDSQTIWGLWDGRTRCVDDI